MVSIPVWYGINFADVNMHLCVSLVFFYSFCISDWAGCTVSNGSTPLFPFLTSDWNNGTSIPSNQVTVVCYLQIFSLKPRKCMFSTVLLFCIVVKRVYSMYLTTTCFLIAQMLVFPTSEDLMVLSCVFHWCINSDLEFSYKIQI